MDYSFILIKGCPFPPSLIQIIKKVFEEIKEFALPSHSHRTKWCNQGEFY